MSLVNNLLCHRVYERAIVDGKPHFGLYFGSAEFLHRWSPVIIAQVCDRLFFAHQPLDPLLEKRYPEFIERPPHFPSGGALSLSGTVGYKYMLWGRAFRVMRLVAKGVPRFRRGIKGGRRRRWRVV